MKHLSGRKNAHIGKSNTSDGRCFCKEVLWQIQQRRQNRHEKDKQTAKMQVYTFCGNLLTKPLQKSMRKYQSIIHYYILTHVMQPCLDHSQTYVDL